MRDWLYPYFSGAGHGARERYREGSRRWRIRVVRHPRRTALALLLVVCVVTVVAKHDVWIFALGFVLGSVTGGLATLLDSPPWHIEKWRTGWEGERRTARALAPLRRSGCVLLHDLPDRGSSGRTSKANLDHVVVSPGGVFLLDSKWLAGEVAIVGKAVRLSRRELDDESYERSLGRTVKASSARLQEDIAARSGIRFVHPVIVFWSDFEAGLVERDGVAFVHGSRVAGWLLAREPKLTPERVAEIAACIESERPPRAGPWWMRARKLINARGRAGAAPATGSSV